jgi:ribosome-associated toxin RatA of RatAB toxin-antitoxin module
MTLHRTEHDVLVAAPAAEVFALLDSLTDWPLLMSRIVHVEPLAQDGPARLAHFWALSARGIDDAVCRVMPGPDPAELSMALVATRPPASALNLRWRAEPDGAEHSKVTLTQEFEAIADDPDAVRLLRRLLGALAESDLSSLRLAAAIHAAYPACRFSFGNRVPLDRDASADAAFDFLSRPEKWPSHLPGVVLVSVNEERPGVQRLEMTIEEPDGSMREERAARLCFPQRHTIVQKDLRPRAPLFSHTAVYSVTRAMDGEAGSVACRHTMVLDPLAVAPAFGPDATFAHAAEAVRRTVSVESLLTLRWAALVGELGST